jgi:membrane protease YdiL (CAAX protease family)
VLWFGGFSTDSDIQLGLLSFFESLTEEVFFRGILLLYLWKKTTLPIAYITCLGAFILHHPQHFQTLFLIPTIVQSVLTAEIARRSKNVIGSWMLHGVNRLATIAIFPLIV